MKETKENGANVPPAMLNEKSITAYSIEAKPVTYVDKRRKPQNKIDELGFIEPNIKNAKSKIASWKNMNDNPNARNNRAGYADNTATTAKELVTSRTNQSEQLKSKIKVNNWLVTPEPDVPNPSENYLHQDQHKRKTKNKLLPEIKKNVAESSTSMDNHNPSEYNNPVGNKTYFKKDPWLVDNNEPNQQQQPSNKSRTYDSNLPQVNQKQIYELLNKLTNRKPVRITEDVDLFADIQENNHIFTNKNPFRPKVLPRKSIDQSNKNKILKPIENQSENNNSNKKQFVIYNQQQPRVNSNMSKRNKRTEKSSVSKVVQEETEYFDDRATLQEEEVFSQKESRKTSPVISLKMANDETTNNLDPKQDISLDSLPLELRIGKVAKRDSLYSLRPKQALDASKIQKHTSQIGHIGNIPKIVEGPVVPPQANKHSVLVSHPEIFTENKSVVQTAAKTEPYSAKPLVHPALNNNELPAPSFTNNSNNYSDNVYNKNHLKQVQAQQNQLASLNKQLFSLQQQNGYDNHFDFSIQNTVSTQSFYSYDMNQVHLELNQDSNSKYQDLIYHKPETRKQLHEYVSNSRQSYPAHNGVQHTQPMLVGSLKLPEDDELIDHSTTQNGEQQQQKQQRVQIVESLKMPGTADGYTNHFNETKKKRINVADSLKLPGQANNNPLKGEYSTSKSGMPTPRFTQIYKHQASMLSTGTNRPKTVRNEQPIKRKIIYFAKPKPFHSKIFTSKDSKRPKPSPDKSPRYKIKNGKKFRSYTPEEKFNEDGRPITPGRLLPVFMFRHGRKLPVTSFRPYVPPPPPKKPKVIMSMESVLMPELKLPFMVESPEPVPEEPAPAKQPTLIDYLKLPVEKTPPPIVKEEPIVDLPIKEKIRLKLESFGDFKKKYRGDFHYPPEYAQRTEDLNSQMPDMEKIDWENYDDVVEDDDFEYDRPPELKLELKEDTEKLRRVRILKAPPTVDEDGVLQVEATPEIPESPPVPERTPTPEPTPPPPPPVPVVEKKKKKEKVKKHKKSDEPEAISTSEQEILDQPTEVKPRKKPQKKRRTPKPDDPETEHKSTTTESDSDAELIPTPRLRKSIVKSAKSSSLGDDTAIDLPTDVTTISLRKSERELTDVPEVELKEYLEYNPELPKQGSLPEIIPPVIIPIKSALKLPTPKANTVPQIKKKKSKKIRFKDPYESPQEYTENEQYTEFETDATDVEDVVDEDFIEYLKEASGLDVNIERHEELIAKIQAKKKKKRKASEETVDSVKKFHFHVVNGSNRIVFNEKVSWQAKSVLGKTFNENDYSRGTNITQSSMYVQPKERSMSTNNLHYVGKANNMKHARSSQVNLQNDYVIEEFNSINYKPDDIENNPDHFNQIYSESLKWKAQSKVKSFENFLYRSRRQSFAGKIFSEKPKWKPENRLQAVSQMDLRQTGHHKNRILIFHDLPKWDQYVDSKVKSFENYNYKEDITDPNQQNLKIYDEKKTMRWNSESRIKSIIYADSYIPQQQYFKIPKYNSNKWAADSKYTSQSFTARDKSREKTDKSNSLNPLGWYPGSNVSSFNVYYKPLYSELKSLKDGVDVDKLKWRSDVSLRGNYQPHNVGDHPQKAIYSEKLKWNSKSKLRNILWENFDYKKNEIPIKLSKVDSDRIPEEDGSVSQRQQHQPKQTRKQKQQQQQINANNKDYQNYYPNNPNQQSNNNYNYNDLNQSLTDSGTDLSYQTKYIKIKRNPPKEYLFGKKQAERDRIALQYQKFKAQRRMKLVDRYNVDQNKVNSIQNFSKYKETLPQIRKPQQMGHAFTDRPNYQHQQYSNNQPTYQSLNPNYYQSGYLSDRSRAANKSSRSNYKDQIVRKKFVVPEIKHSNLRRFQWDQDLKKRAKSQLQNDNEEVNRIMNNIQKDNPDNDATSLLDQNQSTHDLQNPSIVLNEPESTNNPDSHLYGVELINDLKERDDREHERKNQYSRKSYGSRKSVDFSTRSTPFSQVPQLNFINDELDGADTPFENDADSPVDAQLDRTTPRRVKKKIKQIKLKQRLEEQENTRRELESRNRRNNYDDHDPQMDGVGLMGNSIRVESQTRVRPLAGMNFKKAEETAKIRAASRLYSSMMANTPRSFMSNHETNQHYLE